MDGYSKAYGSVGAVPGVPNAIKIASCIAKEQLKGSSLLGRIPPMFLVGEGAREWGKSKGINMPDTIEEANLWLVTERAKTQWRKYKTMLADAKQHNESFAANSTLSSSTDMSSQTDSGATVEFQWLDPVQALIGPWCTPMNTIVTKEIPNVICLSTHIYTPHPTHNSRCRTSISIRSKFFNVCETIPNNILIDSHPFEFSWRFVMCLHDPIVTTNTDTIDKN